MELKVTSDTLQIIDNILKSFKGRHARKYVALLARNVGGLNSHAFLLGVALLKKKLVNSDIFTEKIAALEHARSAQYILNCLYGKLRDIDSSDSPEEILSACRGRLAVALEQACACNQCMSVSDILSKQLVVCRPPKLLPHAKQCKASEFLTSLYNQAIVGGNIGLSEFSLCDLIKHPGDVDMEQCDPKEISNLITCVYLSWYILLLKQYILNDLKFLVETLQQSLQTLFPTHQLSFDTMYKMVQSIESLPPDLFDLAEPHANILEQTLLKFNIPLTAAAKKRIVATLGSMGCDLDLEDITKVVDTCYCPDSVTQFTCQSATPKSKQIESPIHETKVNYDCFGCSNHKALYTPSKPMYIEEEDDFIVFEDTNQEQDVTKQTRTSKYGEELSSDSDSETESDEELEISSSSEDLESSSSSEELEISSSSESEEELDQSPKYLTLKEFKAKLKEHDMPSRSKDTMLKDTVLKVGDDNQSLEGLIKNMTLTNKSPDSNHSSSHLDVYYRDST